MSQSTSKIQVGQTVKQPNMNRVFVCNWCKAQFSTPEQCQQHLSIHRAVTMPTAVPMKIPGQITSIVNGSIPILNIPVKQPVYWVVSQSQAQGVMTYPQGKAVSGSSTSIVSSAHKPIMNHQVIPSVTAPHSSGTQLIQFSQPASVQNTSGTQPQSLLKVMLSQSNSVVVKDSSNVNNFPSAVLTGLVSETSQICRYCNVTYVDAISLSEHVLHDHYEEERGLRSKVNESWLSMYFACDVCGGRFHNRKGFQTHVKTMHGDIVYCAFSIPCLTCDECFTAYLDLEDHIIEENHFQQWFCFECCGRFEEELVLRNHTCSHLPSENLLKSDESACETCNKIFYGHKIFKKHKKHCKFAENCPKCPQYFSSLRAFLTHTCDSVFVLPKPFKCQYCDNRYHVKNQSQLQLFFRHRIDCKSVRAYQIKPFFVPPLFLKNTEEEYQFDVLVRTEQPTVDAQSAPSNVAKSSPNILRSILKKIPSGAKNEHTASNELLYNYLYQVSQSTSTNNSGNVPGNSANSVINSNPLLARCLTNTNSPYMVDDASTESIKDVEVEFVQKPSSSQKEPPYQHPSGLIGQPLVAADSSTSSLCTSCGVNLPNPPSKTCAMCQFNSEKRYTSKSTVQAVLMQCRSCGIHLMRSPDAGHESQCASCGAKSLSPFQPRNYSKGNSQILPNNQLVEVMKHRLSSLQVSLEQSSYRRFCAKCGFKFCDQKKLSAHPCSLLRKRLSECSVMLEKIDSKLLLYNKIKDCSVKLKNIDYELKKYGISFPPFVKKVIAKPSAKKDFEQTYAQSLGLKTDSTSLVQQQREYVCEVCTKICKTPSAYEIHMKVHEVRKFICKDCDLVFHSRGEQRRHRELHREGYQYKCHFCQVKFRLNSHLKCHLRFKHAIEPETSLPYDFGDHGYSKPDAGQESSQWVQQNVNYQLQNVYEMPEEMWQPEDYPPESEAQDDTEDNDIDISQFLSVTMDENEEDGVVETN